MLVYKLYYLVKSLIEVSSLVLCEILLECVVPDVILRGYCQFAGEEDLCLARV